MKLKEAIRDTSRDVDDPNVSMTDPEWHKKYIESLSTRVGVIVQISVNNGLIFDRGYFSSYSLKMLIKPTMKGFWIPISVALGAHLDLCSNDLIGLLNCNTHVAGKISLASDKLRSFELIPIKGISKLDISDCRNLSSLEGMPNIYTQLTINDKQLKRNLKTIFMSCGVNCEIMLQNCSLGTPSTKFIELQRLVTNGLTRKAHKPPVEALLELQAELIDNDFDEFSDI